MTITKQDIKNLENLAYPIKLFDNDIKFMLKEREDLSNCKEYKKLGYFEVLGEVLESWKLYKKTVNYRLDRRIKKNDSIRK